MAELKLEEHGPFTLDQAKQVLGPMLDYYANAIELAAKAANLAPQEKIQLLAKEAEINPDAYFDLAKLYIDQHQDDQGRDPPTRSGMTGRSMQSRYRTESSGWCNIITPTANGQGAGAGAGGGGGLLVSGPADDVASNGEDGAF